MKRTENKNSSFHPTTLADADDAKVETVVGAS